MTTYVGEENFLSKGGCLFSPSLSSSYDMYTGHDWDKDSSAVVYPVNTQ